MRKVADVQFQRDEREDDHLEFWNVDGRERLGEALVLPMKYLPWLHRALERRGYELVDAR